MRYIFIILFQFVCVCNLLQAQAFYYNKTQDIDESINAYEDILVINQDSVLVSGFLRDSTNKRYNTYCYIDPNNGDTISMFKYGRDTMDIYGGLSNNLIIKNNELFSCGSLYKNSKLYANLLKFSLDGNLLLDTLYNPLGTWSEFESILALDDGNFFLIGSKEVSIGNLNAWLVKIDPNGNILWEQTYGDSNYDGGVSIIKSGNQFLISAGKTDLSNLKLDIWLIMIDENGSIVWENTYGGSLYDGGNAIILENGNILILGTKEYDNDHKVAIVSKLDISGNLIWYKEFYKLTVLNAQSSFGIGVELEDNSIILTGITRENDLITDNPIGLLLKINSQGDSIWSRFYQIRNNDNYLNDLKSLENGDFLMVGYVFPDSPDNTEDGWIMRTNCLGYFEHPTDSVVFSGDGLLLNAQNLSAFYEYTSISWGDGAIDNFYEGDLQTINHSFPLHGNYSIETTTVACNDTIRKTIDFTANPPNLTEQNLSVFPNPNDGNFQVWLNSDEVFQIEVFDYNGRLVFTSSEIKLNIGYNLDLTSFDSAVYFLKASSSDNVFQSRIVITQ